ncbi:MAG TPA: class I SAM-dependent methyltransferase [Thermoanaerobaculia bacterium]|jgi:SAM-dependent methyltransferase
MSGETNFAGSIPELYERYLVPMIFQWYADDLAARAAGAARILEVAAGTGVLTRALAARTDASIVATDLNQPMLDMAAVRGTARAVEWRQADVMRLPFADGTFDAVLCQFGAMFFPDKPRAFAEMRRVLAPGGQLLFSVWDRIEDNEFADVVTNALTAIFPDDPPLFMARTPHGYHDKAAIARDVIAGGFGDPEIVTLAARSRASSAQEVALAFCQGTPLRNQIDPARLEEATRAAERALLERFGEGEVDGKMQAHVIHVRRT